MKSRVHLLIITLCCLAWPSGVNAQLFEQTYSDNIEKFKISTPNGKWTFEPQGELSGPVRSTIRFESALDQFTPNVTVHVTPIEEKNLKLNEWLDQELKTFPKTLEVLEKKKISQDGHSGYEIYLRDTQSNIVFLQWFFLAKDRSFVVTCSAKETSYARVFKDFVEILKSFRII